MAKQATIAELFIAADYTLEFTIYDSTETSIIDVSGMLLSWMLKRNLGQPDASAMLEKTNASGITIVGVHNSDPGLNTQKVLVVITAANTLAIRPRVAAHELKRMDAGFETVLSYGPATLKRGVHRT